MKYPGLLSFIPVEDPGLPEPYASGTFAEKDAYEKSEEGKAQYWENFQKINNHTAIAQGNKNAGNAISSHNAKIKQFYDNGGTAKGYVLPADLTQEEVAKYYPPAVDATSTYVPPANGQPGYWVPNGQATLTEVWSLPPGTILFVVQP